jgi:hypothetical protein
VRRRSLSSELLSVRRMDVSTPEGLVVNQPVLPDYAKGIALLELCPVGRQDRLEADETLDRTSEGDDHLADAHSHRFRNHCRSMRVLVDLADWGVDDDVGPVNPPGHCARALAANSFCRIIWKELRYKPIPKVKSRRTAPNQSMKRRATLRYNFSALATDPARGLSLSR